MILKCWKNVLSKVLIWCLIVSMLPLQVFAAESNELQDAKTEAKTFIDGLTVNNSNNDPGTIVKNTSKFFTWDNEKRSSSSGKNYLYEWSYYNGVVFEGLDYIYDAENNSVYRDYVDEYLSSMITNGALNSYAGYVNTHGADCYKTASLLLDYGYTDVAATLYQDLKNAQKNYTNESIGGNYYHTWASTPEYKVWLDGLYMIQPFMAEYASSIKDTDELDAIAARFAWIGENMVDDTTGLYYHAANSNESYYNNNKRYWGRAIGWYAAAMVDVMDYMSGTALSDMQSQLKSLVDAMVVYQDSDGMWHQFVNVPSSSIETSATSLMAYAIQKAVNKGWLEDKYAIYAEDAFVGICQKALDENGLHYICFKGSTSSYSAVAYDTYVNEGKGLGPFIMAYAAMMGYGADEKEDDQEQDKEEIPSDVMVTDESTGISVVSSDVTEISVVDKNQDASVQSAMKSLLADGFKAYDITLVGYTQGNKAEVRIPVPSGMDSNEIMVYYIPEDGTPELMSGSVLDGYYVFETNHFSTYAIGVRAAEDNSSDEGKVTGSGFIVGESIYALDTTGIDAGMAYLVVSPAVNGVNYALQNNDGKVGSVPVTVSDQKITVKDDSEIAWVFSDSTSGTMSNGGKFVSLNNGLSLVDNGINLSMSNSGDGYKISYATNNGYYNITYYLRYNNGWTTGTWYSSNTIYLYKYESASSGEEVEFTLKSGSVTLMPGNTKDLTGSVMVGDQEFGLSDCTIEWESSNTKVATVDKNGNVTGEEDGTAEITATLSAVDGKSLQDNIVLTVLVNVQSKKAVSIELLDDYVVKSYIDEAPDYSEVKALITFDDGTSEEVNYEDLVFGNVDTSTRGYKDVTVSYGTVGCNISVLVLKKVFDYSTTDKTESYPEYPDPGAVRINKTAQAIDLEETGVVKVELDVAGISVKSGVNVLMITDISNSMSWNDSTYDYNDSAVASGTSQRLNISKASSKEFARELLDSDGENKNTFTLLAFAGIDGDYNTHNTAMQKDDVYQLGDLAMTNLEAVEAAIDKLKKATTGGTNYDYAFQQAYSLAQKLYALNGQEVHIVFMTDGAPTHYNGVYYKSRNNTDLTGCMQYVDPTTGQKSYYTSTGNDRNGNDIDLKATKNVTIYYNDGGTTTKNVTYNKGWSDYITNNSNGWAEKVKTLEYATIYSIGFGLKNGSVTQGATGSMPTLDNVNGGSYYIPADATSDVLKTIATSSDKVFEADNPEEVSALYKLLAHKIKLAGTNAQVTDIIGDDFELQLSSVIQGTNSSVDLSNYDITPSIEIWTHGLYTKDMTSDTALIGTRIPDSSSLLEKVTFNDEGTEAYSNVLDDGKSNIMTISPSGEIFIDAKSFTYVKSSDGTEDIYWKIGNITDKEISLVYYAYLEGSLTGEVEKGTYPTNENAKLEYIDINGKYAVQEFPIPEVGWGGAYTTIEYYLVNENGQPVNRKGDVIPFANRIIVQNPVTEMVNLYGTLEVSAKIEAGNYLPEGYYLYDVNAYYVVQPNVVNGLTISAPSYDAFKKVSYGAGNTIEQTGAQTTIEISGKETKYKASRVAFGVCYNVFDVEVERVLNPDTVVLDYGQTCVIDVMANDTSSVTNNDAKLKGFYPYSENMEVDKFQPISGSETLVSDNGIYGIQDGKVQFTLKKFLSEVEKVFCVTDVTQNNTHYNLFQQLNIIPANNVYYEDSFTTNDISGDFAIEYTGTWTIYGTSSGNIENVNGPIHGWEESLSDDDTYSDGSAHVTGFDGTTGASATFTFTGTGVDIYSRTNLTTGLVVGILYSGEGSSIVQQQSLVMDNHAASGDYYQIPTLSFCNLEYGTYTVKLIATAASESMTGQKRYLYYLDGIRIYNPLQSEDAIVKDAYDDEWEAVFKEVRDILLDTNSFGDATVSGQVVNGAVFIDLIDGKEGFTLGNVSEFEIYGPKNEVYLGKDQAIAFKADNATEKITIGLKAPEGITTAKFSYGDATTSSVELKTASDLYYKVIPDEEGMIMIQNTGDKLLAVTKIKSSSENIIQEVQLERLLKYANAFILLPVVDYAGDVEETTPSIENPFEDVKESEYYYDAVLWAVQNNITKGISETIFGPEEDCTRGQVVTFLWRAADSPKPNNSNNLFKDVKKGEYYYDAVLWAVENGITNGMSVDTFGPDEKCTRGQIVTFLWRAQGSPNVDGENPFKDVRTGEYYYDAVLWAVENGITNGTSADTFSPDEKCTRGQVVTFLYRCHEE